MADSFVSFDAGTARLQKGINVVEASAGTGKTYSIAMLVLRFVVEYNIGVEEILVVTYTRAATEELRGRIRSRLVEARDILNGDDSPAADPALIDYLRNLTDKKESLQRLQLALLDMDRAPVFTIHGFCQRMLQEQPLESGQLFDMNLCADISQVRKELVADFWRRRLYDLSPLHCSFLLDVYTDPQPLYASVKKVGAEDLIEPEQRISLDDALQQVDICLAGVSSWWHEANEELEKCFAEAIAQRMFKKELTDTFSHWWEQCQLLFTGESEHFPPKLEWLGRKGVAAELNGTRLRGAAKKSAFLQDWPLAAEQIEQLLAACEQALLSLRIELALELQNGLRRRLQEQGLFSFDDLILQLARALEGESKVALQQVLADRFQVALIDEFQDTDVAQYRIFSTLFSAGAHYLFLIGDPKQAIYKFRGADIYAYFAARDSADQLLSLARNYRSNPLLVQGVNNLFSQRENSFVNIGLPYNRVQAAKPPEILRICENGRAEAAMVYCCVESPEPGGVKKWTSKKLLDRLQSVIATEIRKLLLRKNIIIETGEERKVAAGDIAILVRNNKQAENFQKTLALADIPSVMSSRKSVFTTDECADLQCVLEAVAVPSDVSLLCRALSCKWFALNGQELYAVLHNEMLLDARMERFYAYHQRWQEKGVLSMINMLFARESVLETLCSFSLARRQIANLNHLVEILQEEEAGNSLSISHCLQYLAEQRESGEETENAQLRLESDDDAVQIVTMHGVKGLEYPIVFCPCLWYRSSILKREKHCVTFHDEQNRQVADLGSPAFKERRKQALVEELAEEMRLLYVAVTRASCRSYLFWADTSGVGAMQSVHSALSHALSLDACKDIDEQAARLQEVCDGEAVEFRSLPGEDDRKNVAEAEKTAPLQGQCRHFPYFPLTGEWLMTSYSALTGIAHHSSLDDGRTEKNIQATPIYNLPFGASFGNVVHGVLEDYPFTLLAGEEEYKEAVEGQCRRFGVSADSDQLMAMLRDVTRTPLGAEDSENTFCLADLAEEDVLKEMGFYFHLREESTRRINEILAFSEVVRPIQEKNLSGYLTGFVDLLCRYRGKYYVIDYKSNYLGDFLHDYTTEKLITAMRDHNYGLQYWIYTLVLHRFLQNSLQGYKYEETFGGVLYLFTRGMRSDCPGNGVFFDRPELGVLDALQLALGGDGGRKS